MPWRHDHDGSRCIEIDLAVRPQRQQPTTALHNQAICVCSIAAATHEIDAFTRNDVLAHNNRPIGLQRNYGIAAEVNRDASQISVLGITHRVNPAACDKHAQQGGFLIGSQRNEPVRIICGQLAGSVHQQAFTSAVATAVDGDSIRRSQTSPGLHKITRLVQRVSAKERAACRVDRQFGVLRGVRHCFREPADRDIGSGIQGAENFDISKGINHNAAAAAVGGLPGGRDAARRRDHKAQSVRRIDARQRLAREEQRQRIIAARRTGIDRHCSGGQQPGVQKDLFPGIHSDGRTRAGKRHPVGADRSPGDEHTKQIHVRRTADQNGTAGIACDDSRCCRNVHAALQNWICVVVLRAVCFHTTQDADTVPDVQEPVDIGQLV